MGWFDPPHKKILARSPQAFQQAFMTFGPALEALMLSAPRTLSGGGIHFRAAVVGRVAMADIIETPAVWSQDAIRYIRRQVEISEHMLAPDVRTFAHMVVQQIAYGDGPNPYRDR